MVRDSNEANSIFSFHSLKNLFLFFYLRNYLFASHFVVVAVVFISSEKRKFTQSKICVDLKLNVYFIYNCNFFSKY